MGIFYLVCLNSLGHLAFVGSRMTTALFALDLGASEYALGAIMALFAAVPMFLAVSAGRLMDRRGPRRPLLLSFASLIAGTCLPLAFPRIEVLYLSSTLLGVSFLFVHIGMNSVIGAHGAPQDRPTNFAWLALSFSVSNALGPLVAGFAIEALGYRFAFGVLAFFPLVALALLWRHRAPLPRPARVKDEGERRLLDLLRRPGLREIFIVSGTLAMAWDLYAFLMPLYGARLGLSAGTIGVIMATFASATFVVRLGLPVIMRHVRPWRIVVTAMLVAGGSYLIFPLAATPLPLMAISFLLGLGLGCAQPSLMALLYEAAPPGRQGEAVGVRTTMVNASQTLMPLASGAVSAAIGMAPLFGGLAAVLLGGAWFARRQALRASAEKGS